MWLPWNDKYEVSEYGEVRHRIHKRILVHSSFSKDGPRRYPYVCVIIDGHKKSVAVHRMIGELFLPQPTDPTLELDHINADKTHPDYTTASNLRWVSRNINCMNKDIQTESRIDKTSDLPHHIQLRTDKPYQCYRVCIKHRGKRISKDRHTLEEAIACRDALIAELNTLPRF